MMIAAASGLGGLLLASYGRTKKNEGVLEERNAETQRTNEAKGRGDEVLAEQRDPESSIERLRRGDF